MKTELQVILSTQVTVIKIESNSNVRKSLVNKTAFVDILGLNTHYEEKTRIMLNGDVKSGADAYIDVTFWEKTDIIKNIPKDELCWMVIFIEQGRVNIYSGATSINERISTIIQVDPMIEEAKNVRNISFDSASINLLQRSNSLVLPVIMNSRFISLL